MYSLYIIHSRVVGQRVGVAHIMHTEMQAVPALRNGYAHNDSPESENFIQLVVISDNSNVIIVGYVPAGPQSNLKIKITISLPQITTTVIPRLFISECSEGGGGVVWKFGG